MKKIKKLIIDILSVIIVLFCLLFIVLFFSTEPANLSIEKAIYFLSISIMLSVFLAGALYNLLKKD